MKTLLANPNASQALTDRIVVAALWKSLCLASADPALITRWDSLFELPAPSP